MELLAISEPEIIRLKLHLDLMHFHIVNSPEIYYAQFMLPYLH